MFFRKPKPQPKPELDFTKQAIVDEEILPCRAGRVRYAGSYWYARSWENLNFKEGELVYVTGLENITLFVARDPGN